jgi:hypothetical protein
MFNTFNYAVIDAVQEAKKQFVKTFVQHEGIANAMNTFVDSQAEYTKRAADASMAFATSLGLIITSKQFFDDVAKTIKFPTATTKKAASKKAA